MVDFLRRGRLPYTWRDPEHADDPEAAALVAATEPAELPLVRLPGGAELRGPSNGEVWRALGIGAELRAREEVDLVVVGGGPAGLGAAVYGASEGLDTLVVESTVLGGQAGTSRRIENYLGFPAGISGTELTAGRSPRRASSARATATPYRAVALEPGSDRHVVRLEDGEEIAARAVVLATGAEYRRLPVDELEDYEGISVFYAAGPPEAQRCGATRVAVVGGGNSAAQAAIWLARGGALVTLLHRRADLRETMSDYLIGDLERYGVAVRDRSEIAELHGADGELEARHAARRRAAAGLVPVPLPRRRAVHRLARDGRRARRRTASSSPAPTRAPPTCSRPRRPGSTPPATCAPARSSAARPRSARARSSSASSTSASRASRRERD